MFFVDYILDGAAIKSADAVNLLPEHIGRDERDTIWADMKTFAIFLGIDPCLQPIRNPATLVHDNALQGDMVTDIHVRQQIGRASCRERV